MAADMMQQQAQHRTASAAQIVRRRKPRLHRAAQQKTERKEGEAPTIHVSAQKMTQPKPGTIGAGVSRAAGRSKSAPFLISALALRPEFVRACVWLVSGRDTPRLAFRQIVGGAEGA